MHGVAGVMRRILVFAISLLSGTVPALRAQTPDSDPASAAARELRDEARTAQRDFERTRRERFPRVPAGYHRCDEYIGRFCLWHDRDQEEGWEPVPEHPEVLVGREALIDTLARIADAAPADWWIHGQRIRYLLEADRPDEATAVARECRSPRPGWCSALRGWVAHASGDYQAAEMAFARARLQVSEETRCEWDDLSDLLTGGERGAYRRLGCAERSEYEARFWRLADPLYLVPGNDRRTEHYARHVIDQLQEGSANGYGLTWGKDLRELLLRYGWPVGWDVAWKRYPALRTEASIQTHRAPEARHYLPRSEWVASAGPTEPGAWEFRPERPKTLYAPPYARPIETLDHQLAAFRRAGRTLLVGAWEVSRDTGPPCESLRSGLFAMPAGGRPIGVTGGSVGPDHGALLLEVHDRTFVQDPAKLAHTDVAERPRQTAGALVSLEVRCPAESRAARARYGVTLAIPPTDGRSLSQLLLLRPGERLPDSLGEAVPMARGAARARSGERLGLFWEIYDASRRTRMVDMTLTLRREGKGFLRSAVEWIGLAEDRTEAAGLRWREEPDARAIWARAVTFEIPDVAEGDYRLHLQLLTADGQTLETDRALRIEN